MPGFRAEGRPCRRLACAAVAAALGVCATTPAHAAEPRLHFDRITVEDGLAFNWVTSILKDSRGFLWFGTSDGLDRYDGHAFRHYRGEPKDSEGLSSRLVAALFEDSRGRLWVGSAWAHAGVARYERASDRFRRLPSESCGRDGRAFAEDHAGRVWIGTENGLARYDEDRDACTRFPLNTAAALLTPGPAVVGLLADRKGWLWVGTVSGLWRFDTESGSYARWPGASDAAQALAASEVAGFYQDPAGALWIATLGAGLFQANPESGELRRFLPRPDDPESLSHLRVRCVTGNGQGLVYVGTENGGLCILATKTGKFARYVPDIDDPHSLNAVSIWSLLLDDQGILWIGTYNGGVNLVSPLGQRFRLIEARRGGLSDPHVTAVLEDRRGDLWVGTNGGGLNRFERGTGRVRYYRHDPHDPQTIGSDAILTLLEDSAGSIWLGGWDGGMGRLDPSSGHVRRFRADPADPRSLPGNDVWRILELTTGELLVTTQTGSALFDRRRSTFTRLSSLYGPDSGTGAALAATEDKNGDLWVDASALQLVERRRGKTTTFPSDLTKPEGLGPGVQALLTDSAGNVWIGSERGLNCIEARTRRSRRRITSADGLPHDNVTSLLEDEAGNLWVGTSRGLARIADAVRLQERPIIATFDTADGLQGQEFVRGAAFRSRRGEMFFGGQRGLNTFFPAEIRPNPEPPPVAFTDLRVFYESVRAGAPGSPLTRPISETDELTLSYRESVVTFDFAALNFLLPEKNRYAYRLFGFDEDWRNLGRQGSVTFTNLSAGDYTLHVRAANNDGVWNETGRSLRIHVSPPWWGALWFRAGVALLLAAGLVLGYRSHVRGLESRRRELERLVGERTRDLHAEQSRLEGEVRERRRAEEEIRRLNEGLEERVAERTAQLQAETERLAVTLRSIGDGVIATDVAGRIVLMNRVAELTTGWPSARAIGRPLGEVLSLVDRATRAPLADPVKAVLGGEGALQIGPALLLTRDGREVLVSDSAAPIHDPQSLAVGVVLVFRDVSEKQRIEEQLQNAAKLESLGLLAGGIAHDFNNLLAGIFGHIELARRHVGGNEAADNRLQSALEVMERARGLTQQLLTFTKADQPVTAPVALRGLVQDAARFALAGSSVSCTFDLPDDLWPWQADRRQIEQVLDNILINARQAMPDGGTVSLAAENVVIGSADPWGLAPGRYVTLVVRDHGVGIPREVQAKVFDPFFTTKPTGTGLGLATSYSIAKKHGGHITLESDPGVGSTFRVCLPAAAETVVAAGERPAAARRGEGRVLVMDDEPHVREIARECLGELGYEVATASNGSEAVAAFERAASEGRPFAVVILDLTIPGHSGGVEVLARLRARGSDVRAIASSGYSSDPVMAHPQRFGFSAVLAKPYRIAELSEAVRAAQAPDAGA
jgi:PAS domain S-box-containing protein